MSNWSSSRSGRFGSIASVDLEVLEQLLRPLQRGADKLGNIGWFARQLNSARLKPRHIEKVADEAGHASAFLLDGLGEFQPALGVESFSP